MKSSFTIHPLGDRAILIEFTRNISISAHEKIMQVSVHLKKQNYSWIEDVVPAYTTLTIFYDPLKVSDPYPYQTVCQNMAQCLSAVDEEWKKTSKTVEIPVCYGGTFGPDLKKVAAMNNLKSKEVIDLHSRSLYRVYFLGFSPGFPFLGDLSPNISAPRRKIPRKYVPAGSVGIAGNQTGIYPQEGPLGVANDRPHSYFPFFSRSGAAIFASAG